ncbi:SDR family NAD(P)-dependent oxidoreductase [Ornithinibacillus bavariensis]|uniref:SDR family oxidoreductase n=1 Tax=Ornithinibacillus bavariensis TaxID=545502 RepID=A0A920C7N3_9BACI|nr:SDR family oxidoreductase [Ornithinibacillus bavariensis]GIO27853.1 SDR family oxidoreductase [Ornithinibacillus bavariensis]HAM80370.1 short-chain dehydrogenase [Ornithinibacillus sp.]
MPSVAITGAGTGLGKALAFQYAKNGYKVYLLGRRNAPLQIVQHGILQNGGEAEVVLCDVREIASVQIAFQRIEKLDVFINNAGIGIFGPVMDYSVDDIDAILDTNVKGTVLTVQAALPLIRESKGRILTIISTAGLRGKVDESLYCASKFAVRGFTEALQEEWNDEDFTITAVYMGGMNTPFWNKSKHVKDPSNLKAPEIVAEQIFAEDDGRKEIIIDR